MTPGKTVLRMFLILILLGLMVFTGKLMWDDYRSSGSAVGEVAGVVSPVSVNTENPVTPELSGVPPDPTVAPPQFSVTFIDVTKNLDEGQQVTFTWNVNGPAKTIKTTAVYFGTESTPHALATNVRPEDTRYRQVLPDFLLGMYDIPLRFVGSMKVQDAGTYYARAYAYINGKHYWSPERMFTVNKLPEIGIRVVQYPETVKAGDNASFTWDVSGPPAIAGFTAIAGGRQSHPGLLDPSVDISQTPYTVITRDFTNGTYNVPLRFIGNARIGQAGTYYFRAVVSINGKNIWSDEYSLTVTE